MAEKVSDVQVQVNELRSVDTWLGGSGLPRPGDQHVLRRR